MKTNISWKYSHFIVNIIVIVSFVLGMLNLNLVNVVAGPEQPDEFTPLEVVPETEYQVVQNSDKVLMSLALGNGDKVSQYGPVRNDPSQGIPTHAYSPFDDVEKTEVCPPGGCDYVEGRVLIKFKPEQTLVKKKEGIVPQNAVLANSLNQAGIVSLKPLFSNAIKPDANAKIQTADGELIPEPDLTLWFEGTTVSSDGLGSLVEQLQSTEGIAVAEPDFIRKPIGGMSEPEGINSDSILPAPQAIPNIGSDPLYSQQWHLAATHVPEAWAYLESQGLPAGGSRDIVVAVIDTGVDYTHPDLAANIWVNPLEFNGLPDVDDDGNGYVDDIHGVDTVTPDGNPQDDHGHGTHVAGIIAAQAGNGIGGVGVAYNVQIMPIKAAQYSGVLAASDIAEGIYYAVAKGADVINMSFGGYARSQVEEDALAVAFGQAVLVAAAGNDGKINVPCPGGIDMYPAAYNWVLGVMASTESGDLSNFSNRDCKPHDTHEYELKAPGENIWSTLPEGQYSPWSGTSMSAPVVSGIAALARTKWADKDVYSSRFIMGQIASNTSQEIGGVANALTALAIPPRPELSYLEHWLFDTIEINPINDNDGIVDAGETVDLAIEIRNHWGKAENVIVTLEPWAEGAVNPDPYVTMINDTVSFGAIGSFNWDDNGLIYDVEGAIVGVQNPFQFITDPNTPNDHLIPFRLTITADNGYYPGDPDAPYTFVSRFYLLVQRGRELPRVISENMVLTKDYYWLVPDATLIEAGASVLVTEGTQIQFWSVDPNDPYSDEKKPYLQVEGNFETQGSFTEPVEMFNGKGYFQYGLQIVQMDMGHVGFYYTRLNNPLIGWEISGSPVTIDALDHCFFSQDSDGIIDKRGAISGPRIRSLQAANTIFKKLGGSSGQFIPNENMSGHQNLFDTNYLHLDIESINDSVFLKNVNYYTSIAMGVGFRCNLCDPALGMSLNGFRNNAILNTWWDSNINHWMRFYATATGSTDIRNWYNYINNNFWGTTSPTILDAVIVDYNDDFNYPHMVYQPILTIAPETAYPFVVDVHLSTTSNPDVSEVGAEPVTFTVSFNRDMDQTIQPQVSFGPDVPLTDYTVHSIGGGWQNARTWAGTFNINPVTGDGYQLIRVAGAVAADDPWLVTGDDAGRFRFEVITSGTEAMNLQATGGEGYVDLSWTQSDFDLLSGFNLYRSTTQNGTYARINSSIIPPDDRSYRDTDVTPGQPYFYKFTVVKSDMSESDFSNIATATPLDTIAPTLVHTPVTSAEPGLPLTLNASANDNVAVTGVTLYYRRIGASTYLNKSMVKTTGNTYYATIESSILTSPGIQYFIEATDGISITRNGRAENPNLVTVNDRPVVTIVTPNTGSSSGGTAVTITGSNFKTGATVTFGGASASNVVVVNSNQVTCTTPAHFPSSVDVRVTNPDAQYGVLLNGFTFISTAAQVSLPTTGGGNGNVVTVPVNAANLEGLVAASMTITFDPAVLTAKSAATGSLTSGWSFASNLTTPGQVRLSMSSTGGGVGGAGILANIEFEVIGIPGSSSALSITSISLNDGAINVELADGTFSVDDVYNVSGLISFWNGRSPVPGTQLTLTGDHVYTALSGTDGNYTIQGASIDAYALTPSKSDGDEGITAYDASFVLQHDVGLINLNGYAALAADVNSNGIITSMDAFYILQKRLT